VINMNNNHQRQLQEAYEQGYRDIKPLLDQMHLACEAVRLIQSRRFGSLNESAGTVVRGVVRTGERLIDDLLDILNIAPKPRPGGRPGGGRPDGGKPAGDRDVLNPGDGTPGGGGDGPNLPPFGGGPGNFPDWWNDFLNTPPSWWMGDADEWRIVAESLLNPLQTILEGFTHAQIALQQFVHWILNPSPQAFLAMMEFPQMNMLFRELGWSIRNQNGRLVFDFDLPPNVSMEEFTSLLSDEINGVHQLLIRLSEFFNNAGIPWENWMDDFLPGGSYWNI